MVVSIGMKDIVILGHCKIFSNWNNEEIMELESINILKAKVQKRKKVRHVSVESDPWPPLPKQNFFIFDPKFNSYLIELNPLSVEDFEEAELALSPSLPSSSSYQSSNYKIYVYKMYIVRYPQQGVL